MITTFVETFSSLSVFSISIIKRIFKRILCLPLFGLRKAVFLFKRNEKKMQFWVLSGLVFFPLKWHELDDVFGWIYFWVCWHCELVLDMTCLWNVFGTFFFWSFSSRIENLHIQLFVGHVLLLLQCSVISLTYSNKNNVNYLSKNRTTWKLQQSKRDKLKLFPYLNH